MKSTDELLSELVVVTTELFRWQRAAVLPRVRETVEVTLTTTQLRRAYDLLDGTRSSVDVAEAVGISKQALSGWTRKWRDLGIAYEVEGRRIAHLIGLSALGIPTELDDES